MKYNIELLRADILDELEKLDLLLEEFGKVKEMVSKDSVSIYDRGAIGYFLHNFYNGCENIFKSIARFFENDLSPTSWHTDILKRMKIEITGFRPKVIEKNLYLLLNDFRGFRHKFRHMYSFELDWEKEVMVARKLEKTHAMFKIQVSNFLSELDKIEDD